MQKYCSKKVIEKQGIFNYEKVQDMMDKFYHGRKEKHERLWFLLMFQLWYEKWMDNNLAA
jgi:asparagine synthase (glutamine-hydrolysing)